MAEVVLSTEDLTVLGGPSSINVDLDFGNEGIRGSQIFIGEGDPNLEETIIGQDDIKILDLYINIKASDEEYLYLYQYVSENGVQSWKKLFKLIPNTKSVTSAVTFDAGVATVNVPLNQIVATELVTTAVAADFNVQATIENANPVAASVVIGEPTGTTLRVLPITIHAARFSSGTWAALTGSNKIHLMITVV